MRSELGRVDGSDIEFVHRCRLFGVTEGDRHVVAADDDVGFHMVSPETR